MRDIKKGNEQDNNYISKEYVSTKIWLMNIDYLSFIISLQLCI